SGRSVGAKVFERADGEIAFLAPGGGNEHRDHFGITPADFPKRAVRDVLRQRTLVLRQRQHDRYVARRRFSERRQRVERRPDDFFYRIGERGFHGGQRGGTSNLPQRFHHAALKRRVRTDRERHQRWWDRLCRVAHAAKRARGVAADGSVGLTKHRG